jgi:acetylornithine/N-succinyldiaminopimelate aminotransferase
MNTVAIEDKYAVPFFKKIPVVVERGEGVYVWDDKGRRYLDFTAGWGVTCLGHAHPVITKALCDQAGKIIQNPSSGLTYSPARARLLDLFAAILPGRLQRVFFSNSGAEANDAVIKLARKVSTRTDIISTNMSFHGRTISAASATGQVKQREKFNPLMPNYRFVPYNDVQALAQAMNAQVAAVILEPIQGEGGVNVPPDGYLQKVSEICERNGSYMIIDEVQTGFCRTGPMFAIDGLNIKVDFMTMAKGIAGGFPIGAFAVSEEVADKIELGDHGGTYCGNPLGTAVSYAVIKYLIDNRISDHVRTISAAIFEELDRWQKEFGNRIADIRGRGLLIAIEFAKALDAAAVNSQCLEQGLFVNLTQEKVIRLFPALNISLEEAREGLQIIKKGIAGTVLD